MPFTCCMCGDPFASPLRSLDRRVQSQAKDSQGRTVITIHEDESAYLYDSVGCRDAHEPMVIAQLLLKNAYPSRASVVPCSRCGNPVYRTSPHVAYAWATLEIEDGEELIGHCTEDRELAVLCHKCEAPGVSEEAERQHVGRREAA